MIERFLREKINAASSLTAIRNKVYPLVAPQNESLPYAVYKRAGTDQLEIPHTGFRRATVEITVWHNTYSNARDLAARLSGVLHGCSGVTSYCKVYIVKQSDLSDTLETEDGKSTPLYGVQLDYECDFNNL